MSRYQKAARESLRFRQVHLDFHTSEHCPDVGSRFDADRFADTLAAAHVDSVTCFARCHHGWSYHDTTIGAMHPNLDFDMLTPMTSACHDRDINVPVYVTVGWDERAARLHPDWLERTREGAPAGAPPLEAGWRKLCLNTSYLDYLDEYTREIVAGYDLDGLFMDIVWQGHCFCPRCLQDMRAARLDPAQDEDCETWSGLVLRRYYNTIQDIVDELKPGLRLFHNKGNVDKGRRDLLEYFTHWEIESLPTGGWGYDHFPGSARYSHALGMEFMGMTGKFHTSWGEFGGYKTPAALKYETSLTIAMGGACSIGDQLHPSGAIDDDTYRLIGAAYADVASKEEWCRDAVPVSDIAVFSYESEHNRALNYANPASRIDEGAVRMLLEKQIMFDVIDHASDMERYRLVIFPDGIVLDDELAEKCRAYLAGGGAILSSGTSLMDIGSGEYVIDIGANYTGESEWEQDYIVAGQLGGGGIPTAPMIMYARAVNLDLRGGEILATTRPPYFNRTWEHFCSHRNTPYAENGPDYPAAVRHGAVIHFAHRVFTAYRSHGQQYLRDMVMNAVDMLCPDRRVQVTMPSGGRMTFMRQEAKRRHVLHLLYAVPIHRGDDIDVIEDVIPLNSIPCSVALDSRPARVYAAPSGEDIPFTWENGRAVFTVPEIRSHAMIVIDDV